MLAAMAWIGGMLHAQPDGEAAKLAPELGLPFTDHALLQQKMKLPVWGSSRPGATVTIRFAGQTKTTMADRDGSWRVELDPMAAVKLESTPFSPPSDPAPPLPQGPTPKANS